MIINFLIIPDKSQTFIFTLYLYLSLFFPNKVNVLYIYYTFYSLSLKLFYSFIYYLYYLYFHFIIFNHVSCQNEMPFVPFYLFFIMVLCQTIHFTKVVHSH